MKCRITVAALAVLALATGPVLLRAAEPTAPSGKEDILKAMGSQLGLNAQQENQIRAVVNDFDKKEEPVVRQLWTLHHQEKEAMRQILTAEQRDKVPALLKEGREIIFQDFAKKLNLDAQQKGKIARIREQFDPKFRDLVADQGDTSAKFLELRNAECAALSKELTEEQRARLPGVMREEFRKWRDPELQREHLKSAADELGLNADQRDHLKKIQADFMKKAEQPADQLKQMYKDERAAVEKVLTTEQRTKFEDLLGLRDEQSAVAEPSNRAERNAPTRALLLGVRAREWLGEEGNNRIPEEGVQVTEVLPDTPAAEAGLRQGDVILGVDGEAVSSPQELRQALRSAGSGQQVTLKVMRGDQARKVRARLEDGDQNTSRSAEEQTRELRRLQTRVRQLEERIRDLEEKR